MIKRPRVSSIWSADLNNLLPFYRDVLALPVGLETADIAKEFRRLTDAGVFNDPGREPAPASGV